MKNKNTSLCILFVFTFFIFSCSSDDSKGNDQGFEDEEEEVIEDEDEDTEETGIDASVVFENVIIDGGSKESGSLSTPNETITFELVSGNIALLTEGFDIELNSDSELSGAYLQFKNDDGSVVDGYYDIDFSALSEKNAFNKSIKGKNTRNKINTLFKAVESDISIDVDFTSTLQPGIFCYLISVYDAEGNVSKEMEACLKILPWGENDSLTGTWNLTKEDLTEAGDSGSYEIGEEDCNVEETLMCEDSSMLNYHLYCYVTLEGNLILNTDGTYFQERDIIEKWFEEAASLAECEAIYSDTEDYYSSEGKWAYDTENNQLVMAEYKFYYKYGNEEDTEILEEGGAYIYMLDTEISENSLTISEEEIDPDTQEVDSFKDYYTKQ